jgi:hypothetical protein
MSINRRFTIIGILVIVLSMTMATQYATTKIGYEYSIVHPSNAVIRFIGSDNASTGDGYRILRVDGANSSTAVLKLSFGNLSANFNKTYTAAFGIANEERFAVNITHLNISTTDDNFMQIWLHGDRDANANSSGGDTTSVLMYDQGSIISGSGSTAWTLGRGDGNPGTVRYNVSDAGSEITTGWDSTSHVRYTEDDSDIAYGVGSLGRTVDNASDFVWLQISLDIPSNPTGSATGTIWVHFEASTQYGEG